MHMASSGASSPRSLDSPRTPSCTSTYAQRASTFARVAWRPRCRSRGQCCGKWSQVEAFTTRSCKARNSTTRGSSRPSLSRLAMQGTCFHSLFTDSNRSDAVLWLHMSKELWLLPWRTMSRSPLTCWLAQCRPSPRAWVRSSIAPLPRTPRSCIAVYRERTALRKTLRTSSTALWCWRSFGSKDRVTLALGPATSCSWSHSARKASGRNSTAGKRFSAAKGPKEQLFHGSRLLAPKVTSQPPSGVCRAATRTELPGSTEQPLHRRLHWA
mmetsp:Transcript_31842/g.69643  ORF Transcript_31842/g.69643 Transcript_31842/m.69643 type:complete len:269 (-) Transcript_31842:53-859(-)